MCERRPRANGDNEIEVSQLFSLFQSSTRTLEFVSLYLLHKFGFFLSSRHNSDSCSRLSIIFGCHSLNIFDTVLRKTLLVEHRATKRV